ncbi:MAG: hypothetical protein ACTTJH_07315 [Bacteroidales bacterium]
MFDNLASNERKKYFEQDPLELAIDKFIHSDKILKDQSYTVLDIFNHIAYELRLNNFSKSISTKIGYILSKKENEFEKKKVDGKRCYIFKGIDN